jgi:uncharacterized protein (DUF2062 family)
MPRRIFKRFAFKHHEIGDRWFLTPFRHLLHDRRLWGIRRRTAVPAFALGLFVACLPFPGHPLHAALLALLFRVNIPVAAVTTFVSNPVTMGPIYYFCYRVGNDLLSRPERPFSFELSLDWVTNQFAAIWQPLLLGCVLVGAIVSIIGFVTLDTMWRYSIADYKARKRKQRKG